jgi:tetratricopeptide (TPR) repeat protein
MNKTVLIKATLIALFFIFYFSGCVTMKEKRVIVPESGVTPTSVLPMETIDQTIGELEDIINTAYLSQDERKMFTDFLSACKELKSVDEGSSSDYEYRKAVKGLLSSIQRACELYKTGESISERQPLARIINEYSLKKKEIHDSFLSGYYNQVIAQCVELEKRFGKDSLTPEIGLIFSISLAENGMLQQAISVGEKILNDLESRPDLIYLRSNIIKWELKMGNREKALEIYEKLVDNMNERNSIFNSVSKRITADDKDIAEINLDREALGDLDSAHSAEVQSNLDTVERMIKNESYAEAKLFLYRWRLRANEGPEIEIIEKAMESVELAEAKLNNHLENERRIINDAKRLIDGENYEEALSILDTLAVDDNNISQDALKLKELAIEKLISRERDKAAEYFLMAKNSSDPNEKEVLLKSSIEILDRLIEEYPSSPSVKKLNNDTQKVRNMLDNLKNENNTID